MRLVDFGAPTSLSVSPIRRFRPVIVLLSAGLMLAGCGVAGGTSSNSGASGGNQTLTVAAVPGVDVAPLYVARKEGIFRQHGLNVTVVHYRSVASEIQALTHHRVDVAAGDYANFFYAESQAKLPHHAPLLRLIADGYDAAPGVVQVMTKPGSNISSPAQLEGKTIATPAPQAIPQSRTVPYSIEMMATEAVLQSEGLSASGVTWDPMPQQNMVAALRSGQVDAILVTEPYILQAETSLGAVPVLDSCSGVTSALPLLGYFSLNTYADGHSPAVQAFKAALRQAQTASAMRAPVETSLVSSGDISRQDAALLTIGDYPTFLSTSQVQRVADLMYESGMINSPLSVQALVSR